MHAGRWVCHAGVCKIACGQMGMGVRVRGHVSRGGQTCRQVCHQDNDRVFIYLFGSELQGKKKWRNGSQWVAEHGKSVM